MKSMSLGYMNKGFGLEGQEYFDYLLDKSYEFGSIVSEKTQ